MKVLFLIACLFTTTISNANKIDQLKTDVEIARFVDSLSGFSTVFPRTVSPGLSKIRYLKIDIDKNGLTDLLVNDRKIFAIIDVGNDQFALKYVGARHSECRLIEIDTTGPMPILLIKRQNGYQRPHSPVFSEVPDTVTYRVNGFIEYNRSPQKIKIESIKFIRERCFGSCPVYELTIDGNRLAALYAKAYMKHRGLVKAKIDKRSFDEIIDLISYINPDALKANYAVSATDNPSIDIEIKYNGKVKAIHDYGLEGSLGLQQLYLLIEKLLEDQEWQPASS